ncbi:hypothetical protein GMORB2_0176 [Geosmithia morbida]|uniref:Myb-like domain-containing protein n=1 Tax=Geosmithia morbida TaxID=1094350 RepID=A0A9P5D856_9HYPO|nr:uncharacterized protein GMORB2_0176 [Geosmithia morbida]KAF4126440.1 hypothetical protein GMORB2_0176 [Geosmithia morbida]
MPPKKSSDTGTLSDTEMRFIKALFDNMTQKPDTDWDRVADALGLKDSKCAKERWRQMSIRHGWRTDPSSSAGAGASPRKAAAAADKVAKKPATPRKKVKKEEYAGFDTSEDFIPGDAHGESGDAQQTVASKGLDSDGQI